MSDPVNINGWSTYKVHVLESLKRVETQLKEIHLMIENNTKRIERINTDSKWHVRIFTGVWAVIVTAVNILISMKIGN